MKVIVLISGGDTGGAKTHVHTLLQGLNRHIQADLVCFTDGPFAREARALGIRTEILSGNPVSVLKALRDMIRREGYDVIHCHGSRGNLMGALVRRSTGLPVITTVHSDPNLDYIGRPLSALTFGTLNKWALRHIRYHIGVSGAMRDLLVGRGFDAQDMFVIYNGIDFSPRTPGMTRREFLDSLGLNWPDDAVIAGIAARLNPVKDMATLLRGFAAAHSSQPQLRLIIAGDGPEEAMLRELAARLGVAEEVCFAGWLSDTDSFYNALDINTLTSLSETFPYALTEGARFTLPTVASRVGGVPDLIENNVTGLLFEARDYEALGRHLAALAGDAGLRRRLGEQLLEKGRTEFSIDSTVQRQLDIYSCVIRRHERESRRRDGVLVCGAYGMGNAGDEAILDALVGEMRAIDADMPITVLSRTPEATAARHGVESLHMFNLFGFLRVMKGSRLYINGGGSLIQDVTSSRSLWYYLYTLAAAKRRGCRVLMYGCGIGPVNRPLNRSLAARVISRYVDAITLREENSLDELHAFGVTGPEIVVASDPALTLRCAAPELVDEKMRELGLDPAGKYICFCLRDWTGFAERAAYFARAADYAHERYGLTPVFLPINTRTDGAAGQAAAGLIKAPHFTLSEPMPTAVTLGIISRMSALVSIRLHGLIFATSQAVPIVGVSYDLKVSSFLDYLGQKNYVPLAELTEEGLRSLIDNALAADREQLRDMAARLRERGELNTRAARRLLEDTFS